jgi:hypothetical protein
MREGHVEYVRDAPGANDVVVVEEVAACGVGVDGHVLFCAGERPTACDSAEERAEGGGVERVTESEEVGKEGDFVGREVVEGSEVACLVYLL